MLIPAFVLIFFIAKKSDLFSTYFSDEIIKKISISNKYFSTKARNITLVLSLIFMIIALARPVTNEKSISTTQELNSFVIALDISKSMLAEDIYPNRITFAKNKLLNIINLSNQSAIGIILFAKNSFILSPLTQDFNSLKSLVENLDNGINFDNGTNIYAALEASNKLLKNTKIKNVILLTDGGEKENFKDEIDYANKNDIKVYTIGLGTKKGSPIKLQNRNYLTDMNGNIISVKLNDNIKNLSFQTNAGYIKYSSSNEDINQIIKDLNKNSSKDIFESKKIKTYTELFYYPLAIAIFLLLIAFSSLPNLKKLNTNNITILFVLLLSQIDMKASIIDFIHIKEANTQYQDKNFTQSQIEYSKIKESSQRDYNIANTLYKQKKYKEAIDKYKTIKTDNRDLQFNKFHNLGNSYAKVGDLEKAIKSYENALKIKDEIQTKENLETVKKALNQNSKNKNKDDNNNKKENNKNKQDQKNTKDNKEKRSKENSKNNKKDLNQKQVEKSKEEIKNENLISDNEEKKWLRIIEEQKNKSLLKQVESSKDDNSTNPW